jgi:hypothetical protein
MSVNDEKRKMTWKPFCIRISPGVLFFVGFLAVAPVILFPPIPSTLTAPLSDCCCSFDPPPSGFTISIAESEPPSEEADFASATAFASSFFLFKRIIFLKD